LESPDVHVARRAVIDDTLTAVSAGLHDEPRAAPGGGRSTMRPQANEAPHGPERKQIAPATADKRRNLDSIPVGFDVHLGPILIVVGVREPLVVVRSKRTIFGKAVQRNLRGPLPENL